MRTTTKILEIAFVVLAMVALPAVSGEPSYKAVGPEAKTGFEFIGQIEKRLLVLSQNKNEVSSGVPSFDNRYDVLSRKVLMLRSLNSVGITVISGKNRDSYKKLLSEVYSSRIEDISYPGLLLLVDSNGLSADQARYRSKVFDYMLELQNEKGYFSSKGSPDPNLTQTAWSALALLANVPKEAQKASGALDKCGTWIKNSKIEELIGSGGKGDDCSALIKKCQICIILGCAGMTDCETFRECLLDIRKFSPANGYANFEELFWVFTVACSITNKEWFEFSKSLRPHIFRQVEPVEGSYSKHDAPLLYCCIFQAMCEDPFGNSFSTLLSNKVSEKASKQK